MNQLMGKVTALAFLVEILTNSVKTAIPDLNRKYIPIIAGCLGILVAWVTNVGVLGSLQIPVRQVWLDYIITGIVISRGSNIVHDLAKTLSFSS